MFQALPLRRPLNGKKFRLYIKVALASALAAAFLLSFSRASAHGSVFLHRHSSSRPGVAQDHIPASVYQEAKDKAALLDSTYISRVIYKNGDPSSGHQAEPAGDVSEYDNSNYSSTLVLGRLKKEKDKVNWTRNLHNVQDVYIYVVDDPHSDAPHLEKNHGREAAVYFSYIIQHYHNLSDVTFFWHNDEIVWHNNLLLGWSSSETLNRLDRANVVRSGYVPSRCDHWPGCPSWVKFNPSRAENSLDPHRLEDMFNPELFRRLFGEVQDFPPYFAGTCCSQFAVSRSTIQSRPVEQYKKMLEWIIEYQEDTRSGMVFEYLWPYIFLKRGILCPTMQDCYCQTYNFCIENRDEIESLEKWNSLRTRREEIKHQVIFAEQAREIRQKSAEAEGLSQEKVLAVEEAFRPELDRLNDEHEQLANRTWSQREVIIKHWRLGVPPVGW